MLGIGAGGWRHHAARSTLPSMSSLRTAAAAAFLALVPLAAQAQMQVRCPGGTVSLSGLTISPLLDPQVTGNLRGTGDRVSCRIAIASVPSFEIDPRIPNRVHEVRRGQVDTIRLGWSTRPGSILNLLTRRGAITLTCA